MAIDIQESKTNEAIDMYVSNKRREIENNSTLAMEYLESLNRESGQVTRNQNAPLRTSYTTKLSGWTAAIARKREPMTMITLPMMVNDSIFAGGR